MRVFDLRLKCLEAVLTFRRAGDLDDLGFRCEGLGDVHELALSFFFEGLVVGFPALVVPGDIVLVALVDAFGVGSKMSSLAIDTFQGMRACSCIISGFLYRSATSCEEIMILGLVACLKAPVRAPAPLGSLDREMLIRRSARLS
jgi:hypothetical protein